MNESFESILIKKDEIILHKKLLIEINSIRLKQLTQLLRSQNSHLNDEEFTKYYNYIINNPNFD